MGYVNLDQKQKRKCQLNTWGYVHCWKYNSLANGSPYVTLYTGVDIFTDVVFAASSLSTGVSIEAKGKTVEKLVNTLADRVSATMIKKIADKLGMLMLEGSTADITSNVYEMLYNEFTQLSIDFGEIIESVCTCFNTNIMCVSVIINITNIKLVPCYYFRFSFFVKMNIHINTYYNKGPCISTGRVKLPVR